MRKNTIAIALLCAALLAVPGPRAEVVEEIVAWVNGAIITKSDLEQEEQVMLAEAYRRFTGDELDEQVKQLRGELLLQMIDRKILLQKALRMFDRDKMAEAFYEMFKQQQGIDDESEFERMVEREGMTIPELKERLLENFGPDEVIRYEVGGRVSISDQEVEQYYAENEDDFRVPVEVEISEIVLLAETPELRAARRPEIDAIVQRLNDGASFAELARETSESGSKDSDGTLGKFNPGDLAPYLEQIAFSLEAGSVSDPLETERGWQLVRVDTRTGGELKTLEEVRERLRGALEDRRYMNELREFLDKSRAESDWCVKKSYRARLPEGIANQSCKSL